MIQTHNLLLGGICTCLALWHSTNESMQRTKTSIHLHMSRSYLITFIYCPLIPLQPIQHHPPNQSLSVVTSFSECEL
ncbi:hypothetical protein PIB30_001099 [Stylosanthes scabra]|uniref:Secreted protein n=1 Tax=Stylosanthes scabra TaxID=79078 RepID=A0ABU6U414_9FABA|nr:hypothetical protein [Stylosanthes scabra]